MKSPDCLRSFFETVWMDNTEAEALAVWTHLSARGSEWADEALACLDAAIANPPEDLIHIMQESGWINLNHPDEQRGAVPYSFAEYVDWLRAMTERFRARLAEIRGADEEERAGE